jgi:exodeoxyribonuclease V beta subunit
MMKPLDIRTLPLKGTISIEASAGTGKTFTIGLIVLRLVMEEEIDLRKLAVVTFTESATGELAGRIAEFLRTAREHAAGTPTREREIADLVDAAKSKYGDIIIRRLADAILNFDLARISTIHGFCSRILSEYTFETKSAFGMNVVEDNKDLITEILADFWRTEIATLGPSAARMLVQLTPALLADEFRSFLSFPGLPVSGPVVDSSIPDKYWREYSALQESWNKSKEKIQAFLTEDKERFNQKSLKVESIAGYIAKVSDVFTAGNVKRTDMMKFSLSNFKALLRDESFKIPALYYITHIEAFLDEYEDLPETYSAWMEAKAYQYLVEQLKIRQRKRRLRSFNSMISDLADALISGGEATASVIRRDFSAVLVDEFQDTDGLQYEIFNRLFHSKDGIFFAVIGDPKQAIYRFRGGDIATYIRARNGVPAENQYTIANNYRSEPRLVDALNRIYDPAIAGTGKEGPFLSDEIAYVPVTAMRALDPPKQGEDVLPPITLWASENGVSPKDRVIGERIADAIVNFMDPSRPLMLGPAEKRRALRLGDIAILVNSHRMAGRLK